MAYHPVMISPGPTHASLCMAGAWPRRCPCMPEPRWWVTEPRRSTTQSGWHPCTEGVPCSQQLTHRPSIRRCPLGHSHGRRRARNGPSGKGWVGTKSSPTRGLSRLSVRRPFRPRRPASLPSPAARTRWLSPCPTSLRQPEQVRPFLVVERWPGVAASPPSLGGKPSPLLPVAPGPGR